MRLVRWGWNGDITQVRAVDPIADGNRVVYRRGGLTEWFVNDRQGLEQGFTISAPPENDEATTLRLELSVSGGLRPKLTPEGDAVVLSDKNGKNILRYAGLRAWDATERSLQAQLSVAEGSVGIAVDATRAVFPSRSIRSSPKWPC